MTVIRIITGSIMKSFKWVASILLLSILFGCVGPGPNGEQVYVLNLAPSPCLGAEQYASKIGAEATYDDLVKSEADVEPQKLVEYDAKLALLQNQSKQACDLFNRAKINWDHYQSEMREVRKTLQEITRDIEADDK